MTTELPAEFSLISRYFAPLAGAGALDLQDDAALFAPPPGRELVLTTDAIVESVHFLSSDPPASVARKLLRVNLSDLAAMGAVPHAYLLTLSVPRATPPEWFEAFAAGLACDQQEFGIQLLGGDTTSTPGPKSLTATVIGHVAPGEAIRRIGAQPGDGLWITGTIGDAALGLAALTGKLEDPTGYLAQRYRIPEPRLGLRLYGIAHACMDISDGLMQDAMHLCRAGGLGVTIDYTLLPISAAAQYVADPQTVLTGGDDYELLFAVPAELESQLPESAVRLTRIGAFTSGPPSVHLANCSIGLDPVLGWSHF